MWRVQSLSTGYSQPSPLFHTSSANSYNKVKGNIDHRCNFDTENINKGHNLRGEIFLPEEVMLHLPLVQRVLYFRLHEH